MTSLLNSGVLRCSEFRRYGHADCVRTYASATGLPRADEHNELRDVVEAEEASREADETKKQVGPPATSSPSGGDSSKGEAPEASGAPGESSWTKQKPGRNASSTFGFGS
ncbi:hypothetical protein MRX96_039803 [Rhipicephalus microplus]